MKPKNYGMFYFKDKNGEMQFRKPTPRQRNIILIYYLRRRSGRMMSVKGFILEETKTIALEEKSFLLIMK